MNYDRNGNITALQRNGKTGGSVSSPTFGLMDNLTYNYNGNRLSSVTDAVPSNNTVDFVQRGNASYTYDADGALKSDANEQISNTVYDTYLKQPSQVTLTDGRWIKYYYDGVGALLKMLYSTGEYYDYVGNFIYKNGTLYQIQDDEGRITFTAGQYNYEFDYKDHLGNTRVSFNANGTTLEKTTETAFDPWGVVLNGLGNVNATQNRFEMQGHEKEMTYNLNRINFGARTQNPTTGRFDRIDLMSHKYANLSPYNYVANNPITLIDPDGKEIWIGNVRYENGRVYDRNGNIYNKGMRKDGTYRGFLGKTVAALDKIRTGGGNGENLINTLQSTEFGVVSISKGSSNNTTGLLVEFSPSQKESGLNDQGKTARPTYIGLSHELIHVLQNKNGTTSYNPWYQVTDANGEVQLDKTGKPITRKYAEISTVFEENKIRQENKLPLRQYDSDKKKEEQRHTANGKSIFFYIFDTNINSFRQYDFNKDN